MASFVERMIGAAKLDVNTYEEVEADTGATGQALAVVVLTSIAGGIGTAAFKGGGVAGVIVVAIFFTIVNLIGWLIGAFLTYLIGTKLLPEPQTKSDVGELLRTIGFSTSPGVFKVLQAIPFLGWVIWFGVWVWMLVTYVIAVRQALDYQSTGRAIGVSVIAWVVQGVIYFVAMLFLAVVLALVAAAVGGGAGTPR